jgi:hypothetical protein
MLRSDLLSKGIVIPLMGLCLVGAAACQRRPSSDPEPRASSPASSETAKSDHPSVPGRNIPCPREGGLDKAGYPCEPPAPRPHPTGKP